MAKRKGQRARKRQRIKHPTQLGSAPPIEVGTVKGAVKVAEIPNEWPLAILWVLVIVNFVAWQEQIVSWFG